MQKYQNLGALAKSSSVFLFVVLSLVSKQVCADYLFISMNAQLYIPSQRYSSMDLQYNINNQQLQLFDINITFELSQTTAYNQTNTIFDFLSCDYTEKTQFVSCYNQNYNYINNRYTKKQPCYEICSYDNLKTFTQQNMMPSLFLNLTNYQKVGYYSYIIDNTFYPCKGGAYQPQLYLEEFINISIQDNQSFSNFLKLTFVLLLQIMMIVIAYLVIMFSKYRKLKRRLEYLKGQLEAQDLLNSFLNNSK